MAEFLVIIFIAVLVIGIIAGINFKIKEDLIQPRQRKKKDNAIAEYKFKDFITAVNELAPLSIKKEASETKLLFYEAISNGVESIGCFKYIVSDKMYLKPNEVGHVKVHNYILSVSCEVKPSVKISLDGLAISNLDYMKCKQILTQLKHKITEDVLYKSAIAVNQLR